MSVKFQILKSNVNCKLSNVRCQFPKVKGQSQMSYIKCKIYDVKSFKVSLDLVDGRLADLHKYVKRS